MADTHILKNDFQVQAKRVADDHANRGYRNNQSDVIKNRNKSSKPVKYAESEIKYDKTNPFATNNNPAQMAQLGFGKDFLAYDVHEESHDKEAELKIVKQNQFENLEDIDFQTNNLGKLDGNPFLQRPGSPSFGKFEKNKIENLDSTTPNNVDFLN